MAGWFIAKLFTLLLTGAMIVVIKRRLLPTPAAYLLAIVLGAIDVHLGFSNSMLLRPFLEG
ncbi:MAG: hypothetical protein ACI9NQ_000624 [Paracoccaceae bacterium]